MATDSAGDPVTDYPTSDDLRWERLARDLPFDQLEAVRKQADGWRNALAGITAVVGAVTLVRGRDDIVAMPDSWRYATFGLLVTAFAALTGGLFAAARASFGRPGERIWSNGPALRSWSERRTREIADLIRLATALSIVGVSAVAAAATMSWFAPVESSSSAATTVLVQDIRGNSVCGALVGMRAQEIVLVRNDVSKQIPWSSPMSDVLRVVPATRC
ncbi:hypothetical protein J5X84_41290 [Streptosporangiaceae bacterium NEAU-GS5]|nr:hypothetical protein [Streptosporangiaceae bacterium NEAU-GS5]